MELPFHTDMLKLVPTTAPGRKAYPLGTGDLPCEKVVRLRDPNTQLKKLIQKRKLSSISNIAPNIAPIFLLTI